ncbi:MAG: FHA domain-containing protein, partial [Planctomycetaceae bacterium]
MDNAQVSRRHAQVLEQSGQYFIECLGAANRTAVNSKLLELKERSAAPLQHNDRIKLGPVRLRFEADGSVPEPVAATSGGFELDDNSSA